MKKPALDLETKNFIEILYEVGILGLKYKQKKSPASADTRLHQKNRSKTQNDILKSN